MTRIPLNLLMTRNKLSKRNKNRKQKKAEKKAKETMKRAEKMTSQRYPKMNYNAMSTTTGSVLTIQNIH